MDSVRQRETHHRSAFRLLLAQVLVLFTASACISLNLTPQKGERSKGVQFTPPSAPYISLSTTHADLAWQNKQNGNSISYFSTCNDPADPSLEIISNELFADMRDLNVIRRDTRLFNAREALDIEVEGKVEGVPTKVRALIFKKNGCIYTLTLVGLPPVFEEDRGRFDGFLRSFQAP